MYVHMYADMFFQIPWHAYERTNTRTVLRRQKHAMKVTKPFLSPVVVVPLGSVVVAVLMMFMTTKIGSPRTEASRQSFGYDTIRYDAMRSKPSLECFQFSAFLFSVFSTTIKLVSDLGCFVCLGAQRATSHTHVSQTQNPNPDFYLSQRCCNAQRWWKSRGKACCRTADLPLSLSWLFSSWLIPGWI